MKGYEHANGLALDLWEAVYPNVLLLALTDTFSTKAFFKVRHPSPTLSPRIQSCPCGAINIVQRSSDSDIQIIYSLALCAAVLCLQDFKENPGRARRWRGLRQDSGDPFLFAPAAREVYESLGIDHREKTIIYSDALDLEKALALKKQCSEVGFIGECEPLQLLFFFFVWTLHFQCWMDR